jgi:hypothetical protein
MQIHERTFSVAGVDDVLQAIREMSRLRKNCVDIAAKDI